MSWQQQRRLDAAELGLMLFALDLKQAQLARFLGLSERHIRRVIRGEAELPVACCLLLSSMMEHGETPVVPKRGKGWN